MKILITGSNGFIGTHLSNKLKNRAELLFCPSSAQNLTDEELAGVDVIAHLGAIARVNVSLKNPGVVLSNNINSTLRLLEWCRLNPSTSLLGVSSSSVKFAKLTQNPYALSKSIGEQMIQTYKETFAIRATSVRPFNVFGPGEADYGDSTTLLKACKKRIVHGAPLKINGSGNSLRDYTHVHDVVDGLEILIDELYSTRPLLDVYDLGRGQPISAVQIVAKFFSGTDIIIDHGQDRIGDGHTTRADINKFPPGWMPKISVLDYIEKWRAAGCPDD